MADASLPRHRRLRSRALKANGLGLDEAISRATAAVDDIRRTAGDPVGDHLGEIRAIVQPRDDVSTTEPDWRAARCLAHDIKGFAAQFDQAAVGDICHRLCHLIDQGNRQSTHFAALISAHLDAADHCRRNEVRGEELTTLIARLDLGVRALTQDVGAAPDTPR